jgi:hypothetical protein
LWLVASRWRDASGLSWSCAPGSQEGDLARSHSFPETEENKEKAIMEEKDQNAFGALQGAPSREELEQHLRARAWKDDAFRQELLANPRSVLERDYEAWFPEGKIRSEYSIKVIEEDEQTLCFVLPPKAPDVLLGMEDLDEEDVSLVAGGTGTMKGCPKLTVLVCPTEGIRCTRTTSCSSCNKNVIDEVVNKIKR